MSHVTRTPLSRSKGRRSTCRGGGILWRPPAPAQLVYLLYQWRLHMLIIRYHLTSGSIVTHLLPTKTEIDTIPFQFSFPWKWKMEWDSVDFCLFRFSVAYSYRLRVITLSRMLHVFLTLCLSAQKSCRRVFFGRVGCDWQHLVRFWWWSEFLPLRYMANAVVGSDVVLETKVLVLRRLEDKKIKSWSWSWQKSLENFQDLWVWLIAGTKNNNLGRDWVLVLFSTVLSLH